jgi:hypothetical protein
VLGFGFADVGVTLAFLVALASTALCVVYGLLRWNADDAALPPLVHPPGENTAIDDV